MTTHPTAVRDAWTIDELVRSDILRRIRHGVFPVVDGEARPVGILTWPPLTGVLSADRETTIVGRIARPCPRRLARTRTSRPPTCAPSSPPTGYGPDHRARWTPESAGRRHRDGCDAGVPAECSGNPYPGR
ncbi:CBS domain-containing protein [Nocardia grenadensis]|uniref:CBS domain-containing protein n=1 Tax=Nocardia grenadensis TaxID=931537 RepID=UPI000A01D299